MDNITTADHDRIVDGLGLYLEMQEKGTEEYTATEALIQQLEQSHGGGESVQARLDQALRLLRSLDNALCGHLRDEDDHTEINGGDTVQWLSDFARPLGAFLDRNPAPRVGN